jgi:hypothetical protein
MPASDTHLGLHMLLKILPTTTFWPLTPARRHLKNSRSMHSSSNLKKGGKPSFYSTYARWHGLIFLILVTVRVIATMRIIVPVPVAYRYEQDVRLFFVFTWCTGAHIAQLMSLIAVMGGQNRARLLPTLVLHTNNRLAYRFPPTACTGP